MTTAATLLHEHFADVLATPQDVERLNQTILDLAMRGKLTQQDSTDEPASKLLASIKAQKVRMIENGELPNGESVEEISDDEIYYELPLNWVWVRLPEISYNWGQKKPDVTFSYIDVSSIDNQVGRIGDELQVIDPADAPSRARKIAKRGSVIYSTVRPYLLNIAIIDREIKPDPIVSTAFYVMHPFDGVDGRFLYLYLRSKAFTDFVSSKMTGMAYPAISDSKLSQGLFPLPPLAEQQRIVARVEQLFAQTHRLAELLAHVQTDLTNLNASALAHLLSAETPEEFERQWQFAVEHFDLLLSDPAHVAPFRQTILELAVRGKLTRQDASDEPASELLKHIQAEKARLVEEGKLGKSDPLPPVSEDEKPFTLPKGWEWATWGMVLANENGAFRRGPFGSSLTKSIFVESGYKVYEQYCAINDDCSFGRYFITPKKFEEMKGFEVKAGDFLMSCSGVTLGRITRVPQQFEKGIINQALLRIRINEQVINPQYFLLLFRSPLFQKSLFENSTGSAIPNVKGVKELKAISIPIPPFAEQPRIVVKVEQLLAQCDALEARLRAAQTNRERLVQSVMAGIAAG